MFRSSRVQLSPSQSTSPVPAGLGRGGSARSAQLRIGVIGAAAAILAGWTTARGSPLLAAPIVAAALLIVLAQSVQAAYAAVIVTASTFASAYALPHAAHLYPAEVLTVIGLAALAFSRSARFGGRIGVLLLALLVTVFSGIAVAKGHGVGALTAVDEARPVVLYAVFWVALAALRANPRRFFAVAAAIAALIVVLSILQFIFRGHQLFLSAGESFVTVEGGFTRVRPPGLVLVYFGLIFAIAYLLWGPGRRGTRFTPISLGLLFALGILLSLNRNMLIGLVLGLVATLMAVRRRGKAALFLGIGGIVTALTLSFLSSGTIAARILSLGNPSGLEKTTLSDRQYENRKAVATIKRHPLVGIGWGTSYGALFGLPSGKLVDRSFIHNQYYGLWMRTGLLGLLAYVALLGTTAATAIRWTRRREHEPDGWLGPAVLASVVAFAASSIVGIYVIDPGSTPVVAALFALAALLREHLARA
jgi:O-antigen ligase